MQLSFFSFFISFILTVIFKTERSSVCENMSSSNHFTRRVTRVEYLRYPSVPFFCHVLCDLPSKFRMITCEKLEALTYKQQSVINTVKRIRRYPVIGLSEYIMSTVYTLE